MFQRPFSFWRKGSDEGRVSRFQRTASQSHSPSPSPSNVSVPNGETAVESTTSLPQPPSYSHFRKNSDRSQEHSNTDPGPLGLNIIYTPENGHKADIVFIHGLGGTSRRTWSKNEDPELFWPLKFLPFEPDVCLTRIFTFGYDANFRVAGNVSASVLDFAKELLFDLKYAKDEEKEELNIGTVPLVFVVHSMGGLIIKEAYMQGQNDPHYESIVKAITAITFLATPHRGTHLAELLDRILRSTVITSSKQYISELAKNSFTLQKLNEQFRHVAPRLDIVSFYETQSTSIGLRSARVMILEKDSSVLGYPGETSKALNADHHNVCKYDSPRDPNYITVRNTLRSIIGKIISTTTPEKAPSFNRRESRDLKSLLAITELPDIDFIFFRDQWAQGTSDWLLEEKAYLKWLHSRDLGSSILWLNGGPATGKSVMSSFIINNLVEQGVSCQYFFVRFGDQQKRSLSLLLRSIAYQIARSEPNFLQRVLGLADEAIDFGTADPRTIWERMFKSILFSFNEAHPRYWIVDGLDEADDPRALIRLLSDVSLSVTPIRILLVSREVSEILDVFQKLPEKLNPTSISIEGHRGDLQHYVRQELSMSGTAEYKESIVDRVLQDAHNNFLWVRLAVNRLNVCHTQADVELALKQLPAGMEALYDRMSSSISQNPSANDRALASTILGCVTSALRVLTVQELSQALHKDTSRILDFQKSIVNLCGGFVVIDNGGKVAMIHQTAREYLLGGNHRPFYVDKYAAHKQMYLNCTQCLMAVGLRAKVKANRKPEFLDYAAVSWSSHLTMIAQGCDEVGAMLNKFLTSYWVLTWIQILATNKELGALIQASKHLSRYSAKQKEYDASQNREDHQIMSQELIKSWSGDFVKIVGKFGNILRRDPEAIYKLIPPFCPPNSAIHQQFGKMKDKSLLVSGLSMENWDDSLARMSFGFGMYASSILAAGAHIAILIPSGSIILYDSSAFGEMTASPIKHGERVYRIELNSAGTLLASYGYNTTKIWEVSTGKCRMAIKNIESRPRPLGMLFTNSGTMLLVGSDDRRVRSLDLNQASPTWQLVAELEEPELEGQFLNSSNHMALSKDGRLIAVAYRGHPLSAWEIDGPTHIGHCWRKRDEIARGEVIEAFWHPHDPEVIGLYIEGVVFKWRPYDGEVDELSTGASRLAVSRDGNLFATGDVRGMVKVYTMSDFSLLYQLTSEDAILSLAFSPDLRRFYDVRGHYGNAWEPNALMRFAEQRGQGTVSGSETESLAQASTASENWSTRIDSITVCETSPGGRLYCCGTEQGVVHLHDTQRGKLADLYISKSFLSIEQMSFSDDGLLFGFSDSSKKVIIMSIIPGSKFIDPAIATKGEIQMKNSTSGPILQLLFHPRSSQLLVCSSSAICTISLLSYSVTRSTALHPDESKWITHPQDPALIIGVGPETIRILDWDLAEYWTATLEYPQHHSMALSSESLTDEMMVERVLITHDKKLIFVQASLKTLNSREKTFLYFATPSCSMSTAENPDVGRKRGCRIVKSSIVPQNVSSQIALSLSFLSHNNLIFLSKDFSVCSWQLLTHPGPTLSSLPASRSNDSVATKSKKIQNYEFNSEANETKANNFKVLFYLPGDWISKDCLALCSIWRKERSLLCPRNGEVAVVRCAALL